MKKRAIIVGGGFAGLFAASRLCHHLDELDVFVFDRRSAHHFLPMLPDVAGGVVSGDNCRRRLDVQARRTGFTFVNERVESVDRQRGRVRTASGREYGYDVALISCGAETNFYGNADFAAKLLKMDTVQDALAIRRAVRAVDDYDTIVVVGCGYTGIEIASHAHVRLDARGHRKRIIMLDLADRILPHSNTPIREYCGRNLERMGIEVRLKTTLDRYEAGRAVFSDGTKLDRTIVVWAAGVHAPPLVRERIDHPTGKQERLQIDECLRIDECCFAAGDAAGFVHKGRPLRLGVQFAVEEGRCAASNMLRTLRGRPLKRFVPHDPGYVVPMANWRSAGEVLGLRLYGQVPTFLHYLLSTYRTFGMGKRLAVLRDLLGEPE